MLETGVILRYSDLIDDELPFEVTNERDNMAIFLSVLPKRAVLTIASHFLGYFHSDRSLYNANASTFIHNYFQFTPTQIGVPIQQRVYQVQLSNPLYKFDIVNHISSLKILNWAFELCSEEVEENESNRYLIEINFLKAYLYLNEYRDRKETQVWADIGSTQKPIGFAKAIFTISIQEYEFLNTNLTVSFFCQLAKAKWLFEKLISDTQYEALLNGLLSRHGVDSLNDIYQFIVGLVTQYLTRVNEGSIDVTIGQNLGYDYLVTKGFFDFFSNSTSSYNDDFLCLRSRPLFELRNDTYRIAAPFFLLDKVYKSWFFELKAVNDQVATFSNFRGFYGKHITEEVILNNALKGLFRKSAMTLSSSDLIDEQGREIPSAPDYYVRQSNRILWFESKDTYLRGDNKMSYDYNSIENDLHIKLRMSGISQIIRNIKRILSKNLQFDSLSDYNDYEVFPILVLHDESFNTPYLNYLINTWFQDELRKLKRDGFNIDKIHSLTILTIDCIISYKKLFQYKGTGLERMIRRYEIKCLNSSLTKNSTDSFSLFSDNFSRKIRVNPWPSRNEVLEAASTILFGN